MGPGVDPHLYKASEGDVREPRARGPHPLQRPPPRGEDGRRAGADRESRGRPRRDRADPRVEAKRGRRSCWASTTRTSGSTSSCGRARSRPIARELDAARPGARRRLPDERAGVLEKELDDARQARSATRIAAIPAKQPRARHGARRLRVLRRATGCEVVGLQGISTVSEAGAPGRRAARGADRDARRSRRSSSSRACSPRSIEAVRKACARRGHDVAIGGSSSPTRWARPARRRARTSAWSGTTSTRSWRRSAGLVRRARWTPADARFRASSDRGPRPDRRLQRRSPCSGTSTRGARRAS